MEQILTIAIPTFNRPNEIQTQIRLLLPQLNENVCLVVYDNCSEIPVKELFTEKELLEFTIVRNRMNIGGDANIARCFEYCSTRWLWTLSDDDVIKTDAVNIILSEISKNVDSLFINFYSENNFTTIGFNDLAYCFRIPRVFSNSFTMTSCVYNMSMLKNYIHFYYNNLSSMVGPTILVLKYVEKNIDAICVFTDKSPINKFNDNVFWNYGMYIRRTRLFIDAFGGKNNRKYNRTLFLGCHKINYGLIRFNRKESNMNNCQRWDAYIQTIKNQGFINAFLFSQKALIFAFLYLILPNRWLNRLKKITHKI